MNRRDFVKRAALVGAGGLPLIQVLAGCTASAPSSTALPSKALPADLRIGVPSFYEQIFDPARATGNSQPWWDLLYDQLIGVDAAGEPSKDTGIARDWTIASNASGATYTLKLRQGIKFSNGDDLTSADVKFSLDRVIAGPPARPHLTSYRTYLVGLIKSVDAPDPYTVVINTKTLSALLLATFSRAADSAGYVVPMKYFQTNGQDYFLTHPIGSGPYVLADNEQGNLMRFVAAKDPHWLHGKQRVGTVTLSLRSDEPARIAGLRTGELDLISLSLAGAQRIDDPNLAVIREKNGIVPTGYFYTTFGDDPLADQRLRRALSLATDRKAIAKAVFYGGAEPTGTAPLSPNNYGYDRFPRLLPPDYDPEQAKSLIKQARPNGAALSVVVLAQPTYPEQTNLALALADMYRAVGVTVTNLQLDFAGFSSVAQSGKLRGTIHTNTSGNRPYPGSLSVFSSKNPFLRVRDSEMDKLLNSVDTAPDMPSMEAAWYAANKYAYDQNYNLPIVTADSVYAGKRSVVQNWQPNDRGVSYRVDLLSLATEK